MGASLLAAGVGLSADDASAEPPAVPGGKPGPAAERPDLAVEELPAPPDTWDVDFEHGVPRDFQRGRFVDAGLPRGSKGAIAAARRDRGKEGIFFEIASPHRWRHGLFAARADSHFHFTFKMDRPGWVNVFVMARGLDADGPYSVNHLFNDLRFWPRPGKWRTVSIPLPSFKRLSHGDGRPFDGEVPYMVLFSSRGEDRGLVIDRMWVTRGGPGFVQYRDVE